MIALAVTLAGGAGAVVRFVLEYLVRHRHPSQRPWATVSANVLGCLITGYVAYHFVADADAHLRSIVLTGFCGGLTTFSSAFAIPVIIAREHHPKFAWALIVSTPLLCTGGLLLGIVLAR